MFGSWQSQTRQRAAVPSQMAMALQGSLASSIQPIHTTASLTLTRTSRTQRFDSNEGNETLASPSTFHLHLRRRFLLHAAATVANYHQPATAETSCPCSTSSAPAPAVQHLQTLASTTAPLQTTHDFGMAPAIVLGLPPLQPTWPAAPPM